MKDEKDDLRSRTKAFALRIIKLYETLPRSGSAHVLGHQLLRSGTSVGANFREAHRARSNAEFISKVGDSLKELEETSYCSNSLLTPAPSKPQNSTPFLTRHPN